MYKQKIGISTNNNYPLPNRELLRMLSEIGFDAVSPKWNTKLDMAKYVSLAKEFGMVIQSVHAPYDKSDLLWDKEKSTNAKNEILKAIDDCAKFNIDVIVMHTWIGFEYTFNKDSLYFGAFDEIVEYAGQKNVKIAFENTEGEEYLFALMERYKDKKHIGFCWDSGHEMCYNFSKDLLALFGDRLFMTHINDNLGISDFNGKIYWTDDLHLLPYDGVGDWEYNVNRLKNSRKLEYLNFELNITSKPNRHENDVYLQMEPVLYFTEAYKRACKIAYNYAK